MTLRTIVTHLIQPISATRALLIAVVLAVMVGSGLLHAAAPLRIMPLGDSITAGYTNNPTWTVDFKFGYRSGLYTLLKNAGYDFQFVGGSAEPWNNIFGDPTRGGTYTPTLNLRTLGQDGHRGYGGTTAAGLQPNIVSWLNADDPDIVLLKIGTNSQNTTALNMLVNTIVNTKPDAQVIVASIMPRFTYQAGVVNYNNYIRNTLVPNYQALGKNVTYVDQYVNFLNNPNNLTSINQTLFSNGINHPSNPGYDRMAQTWFEGIQDVAVVPEPSSLAMLGVASLGLLYMVRRRGKENRSAKN